MKHIRWYSHVLAAFLAVSSGLFFGLSLTELPAAGWVALVPLLLGARLTKPVYAALFGIVAATAAAWFSVGSVPDPVKAANATAMFLGTGLLFAVVSALASFAARRTSVMLWSVFTACAGAAAEWLIDYISPVSVAVSQSRNLSALAVSSFVGIWGASFLIWLISASICTAFSRKRASWPLLVASVLLLFAAPIFTAQTTGSRSLTVAAVQAPDAGKAEEETWLLPKGVDAVVWPELLLDERDEAPARASKGMRVLVVASLEEKTKAKKPYNSAVLYGRDGKRLGSVRKRHLYGREVLDYYSGITSSPVDAGDLRAGVAICYDTVFPDVVRDLASQGAQVVFVPTQDPFVPGFLVHRLHAAMAAFRAAENGIPIVWADTQALSTIYDVRGRVIEQAPADEITSRVATVHLRERSTLYTRIGDLFAYLCAAAAFSLGVLMLVRKQAKR